MPQSRNGIELVDGDQRILVDSPCTQCNYNLRGLAQSDICPECGTPIGTFAPGVSLHGADVQWLHRLRVSLSLLVWAIPALVVVGCLTHFGKNNAAVWFGWNLVVVWGLWLLGWLYFAGATVLLTTQEPRLRCEECVCSIRRTLRCCAIVVAGGAGAYTLGVAHQPLGVFLASVWARRIVELVASGLLLFIGLYLARLAQRIDCQGLKRKTIHVTVALVSISLLSELLKDVADAVGWDLQNTAPPQTLLLGLVGIAGIVYLVRYELLLLEFSRHFREACRAGTEKGSE